MGSVISDVAQGVGGLFGFNQGLAEGMGALGQYNAQAPNINRQDFNPMIQDQIAQQKQLADQLRTQSQGAGPNPAMEQLRQTTQNNIQQNTGMIASQKGINPALATRMAAQNAGMMNQQAAGQGAVMRANQQLAAQQQLGQQVLGMNQLFQGANAAQNQAINQGSLGAQGLMAQQELQNAQQRGLISSSMLNNVSGMATKLIGGGGGFAYGGMVPHMALGGQVKVLGSDKDNKMDIGGMKGFFDSLMKSAPSGGGAEMIAPTSGVPMPAAMYGGGMAQSHVTNALMMRSGGMVGGQANVYGDSPKNDTVPAMLSPGEIVIPRSVAQGANAPDKSAAFVAAVLAKKRAGAR